MKAELPVIKNASNNNTMTNKPVKAFMLNVN